MWWHPLIGPRLSAPTTSRGLHLRVSPLSNPTWVHLPFLHWFLSSLLICPLNVLSFGCLRQHDGRFNVTWEYTGGDPGSVEVFRPDFFLILVRPVLRTDPGDHHNNNDDNTNSGGGGDASAVAATAVQYGRYRATQVNGSEARVRTPRLLRISRGYCVV